MAALALAPAVSLFTRIYEWGTGYDELVQKYLDSKTNAEKKRAWQGIMDNIALYPKSHAAVLTTKFVGDAATAYFVTKAAGPLISKHWKGFCEGLVTFLKSAYHRVCDLCAALKNAAQSALQSAFQKFTEMFQRIFASLTNLYKRFIELIKATFSEVIVIEAGCVTVTIGASTFSFVLPDILENMNVSLKEWWNRKKVKEVVVEDVEEKNPFQGIPAQAQQGGGVMNGLFMLFSGVGALLMWIGSRVRLDVYKYLCSIFGLIEYKMGEMQTDSCGRRCAQKVLC